MAEFADVIKSLKEKHDLDEKLKDDITLQLQLVKTRIEHSATANFKQLLDTTKEEAESKIQNLNDQVTAAGADKQLELDNFKDKFSAVLDEKKQLAKELKDAKQKVFEQTLKTNEACSIASKLSKQTAKYLPEITNLVAASEQLPLHIISNEHYRDSVQKLKLAKDELAKISNVVTTTQNATTLAVDNPDEFLKTGTGDPASGKIRLKAEPYAHDGKTDFKSWKESTLEVCLANNYSIRTSLSYVKSLLINKAQIIAAHIHPSNFDSLSEFMKELTKLFDPDHFAEGHLAIFDNYTQGNEPIVSYSSYFRMAFSKAYPNKDPETSTELIRKFIAGLTDEDIRRQCMRSKPKTFSEAIEAAVNESQVLVREDPSLIYDKTRRYCLPNDFITPVEDNNKDNYKDKHNEGQSLNAIGKNPQKYTSTPSSKVKQKKQGKQFCTYHKVTTHSNKNCRVLNGISRKPRDKTHKDKAINSMDDPSEEEQESDVEDGIYTIPSIHAILPTPCFHYRHPFSSDFDMEDTHDSKLDTIEVSLDEAYTPDSNETLLTVSPDCTSKILDKLDVGFSEMASAVKTAASEVTSGFSNMVSAIDTSGDKIAKKLKALDHSQGPPPYYRGGYRGGYSGRGRGSRNHHPKPRESRSHSREHRRSRSRDTQRSRSPSLSEDERPKKEKNRKGKKSLPSLQDRIRNTGLLNNSINYVTSEAGQLITQKRFPHGFAKAEIFGASEPLEIGVLIDGGNFIISCVKRSFFNKLSIRMLPTKAKHVGTADKDSFLDIRGKAEIKFKMGQKTYEIWVYVVENLNCIMNLSNYDMANLGFLQDYAHGVIYTLDGECIPLYRDKNCNLRTERKMKKEMYHLYSLVDTIISPCSVNSIICKAIFSPTKQRVQDASNLAIMHVSEKICIPQTSPDSCYSLTTPSRVGVAQGESIVDFTNPSNEQIKVRKGQKICSATAMSNDPAKMSYILRQQRLLAEDLIEKYSKVPNVLSTKSYDSLNTNEQKLRTQYLIENFRLEESPILGVNNELKVRCISMLLNNWLTFASEANKGYVKGHQFEIHTRKSIIPIKEKHRPIAPNLREPLEKQIKIWEKEKVIRKSSSPWAFNVSLVSKKDGKLRTVINYQKLNDLTVANSFPIGNIKEIVSSLYGAKIFSTLDLDNAYTSVPIRESDKQKTAFMALGQLWELNYCGFGFKNMPSYFSSIMCKALSQYTYKFCAVYLDDIIIYSDTAENHLIHLDKVLKAVEKIGLRIKIQKCTLFAKEVHYLGHLISHNSIKVPPDNTKLIKEWPIPNTLRELRSFLGKCNYFREHIPNYSAIVSPLFKHVKTKDIEDKSKTRKIELASDTRAVQAFDNVKQALCEAVELTIPQFGKNSGAIFVMDCDFSFNGIAAVLSQIQDGVERPISFQGRKITDRERTYSSQIGELLAILFGANQYRFYLLNTFFFIRTDNISLQFLRSMQPPKTIIIKFLKFLSEFNFGIVHRSGKKQIVADSISRAPHLQPFTKHEIEDLYLGQQDSIFMLGLMQLLEESNTHMTINALAETDPPATGSTRMPPLANESAIDPVPEDLVNQSQDNDELSLSRSVSRDQHADFTLKEIIQLVKSGTKPTLDDVKLMTPDMRFYIDLWEYLELQNVNTHPTLFVKLYGRTLLALPESHIHKIIAAFHSLTGHVGRDKTYNTLKFRYIFPSMQQRIKVAVFHCEHCDKNKDRPKMTQRFVYKQDKVGMPGLKWSIDHIGPLTTSSNGNSHCLTLVDNYSKWCHLVPVKTQSAEETALVLFKEIIPLHGVPCRLHHDLGRGFVSKIMVHLLKLLNIRQTSTLAYSPQSNEAEAYNKVFKSHIRTLLHTTCSEWELAIPSILTFQRLACNSQTGLSPFYIMFGREGRLPAELLYPPPPDTKNYVGPTLENQLKIFRNTYHMMRNMYQAGFSSMAANYDPKANPFKENVLVWVYNPNLPQNKGLNKKFCIPWWGPFKILRMKTDVIAEITAHGNWLKDKATKETNISILRPYQGDENYQQTVIDDITLDDIVPDDVLHNTFTPTEIDPIIDMPITSQDKVPINTTNYELTQEPTDTLPPELSEPNKPDTSSIPLPPDSPTPSSTDDSPKPSVTDDNVVVNTSLEPPNVPSQSTMPLPPDETNQFQPDRASSPVPHSDISEEETLTPDTTVVPNTSIQIPHGLDTSNNPLSQNRHLLPPLEDSPPNLPPKKQPKIKVAFGTGDTTITTRSASAVGKRLKQSRPKPDTPDFCSQCKKEPTGLCKRHCENCTSISAPCMRHCMFCNNPRRRNTCLKHKSTDFSYQ